ncbi:MAG: hypothetical protein ACREDR_08540 [Blastocatellia bacterium]
MDADFYRRAFEESIRELAALLAKRDELEAQREDLDRRVDKVRCGAIALAGLADEENLAETHPELFPDSIRPDMGFTDAVREVLKSALSYMSAIEVRNQLRQRGFDLDRMKSPLPSIHKILSRLVESGEAEPDDREGKTVYRWKRASGWQSSPMLSILEGIASGEISAPKTSLDVLSSPKNSPGRLSDFLDSPDQKLKPVLKRLPRKGEEGR